MHSHDIRFCSQFISDTITGTGVYKRGEKPLSVMVAKGETLIVRAEDAVFDISSGIYNAIKYDGNALIRDNAAFNNLMRIQGRDCREAERRFGKACNLSVPVFYPLYIWLLHLHTLEYPVILLCDDPGLTRTHPLFQLLEFNTVTSEDLHTVTGDSNLFSPYGSDNPDYLFPRSFNAGVCDLLYTVKFDS